MPGQASKQYAVKKTESGSTVGELRSNKLKQRWDELYEKQKLTAQFMERLMRHIVVKDDMDDKLVCKKPMSRFVLYRRVLL